MQSFKNWLGIGQRFLGRKAKNPTKRRTPQLEVLEQREVPAVTVQFDYRFDANNYFTPERRAVLERAAQAITAQFTDELAAIVPSGDNKWTANTLNPSTGFEVFVQNLVVPANTLIVFAGGRDLTGTGAVGIGGPGTSTVEATSSAEFDAIVRGRGQPGALTNPRTDFAPWGGSIQVNSANPGLPAEDQYFLYLHELIHLLGFGTASSWLARVTPAQPVVGTPNFFTGPQSMAKYDLGGQVPLEDSKPRAGGGVDGPAHWNPNIIDAGVAPILRPTGGFLTGLDRAGLGDIGWSLLTDNDAEIGNARDSQVGAGQTSFTITTEQIENPLDVDLYRFAGNKDDKITIFTAPREGQTTVDTFLRIFDAQGAPIAGAEDDNSGAQTGYSRLVFTLPATGTFYVGVSSVDPATKAANKAYLATEAYARGDAGGTGAYSLTIATQRQVGLNATVQSVNENQAQVTVTAQLSETAPDEVRVPFTLGGDAVRGAADDYTAADPLEIVIPAGQLTGSAVLTLVNDTTPESDEKIVVTLQAPANPNAVLGKVTEQTITILDDDKALPTVGFASAAQTVNEATAGQLQIAVTLSAAQPDRDITVAVALSGTASQFIDYTVPLTVTIPKGATSANVTVTILNDAFFEADETVILTLNTPVNATLDPARTVHTATIADDDRPTVKFTATSTRVTEGKFNQFARIEAELSKPVPAGTSLQVPFTITGTATEGKDYTLQLPPGGAKVISFNAGDTKSFFNVLIENDTEIDAAFEETVIITLVSSANGTPIAPTVHTVTIVDNDLPPTIRWKSANRTVNEKVGKIEDLVVELSHAYNQDITIPVTLLTGVGGSTAKAPDDLFLLFNSVFIQEEKLTGTFSLQVFDDGEPEPTETALLKLGTPQGGGTIGTPDTFTLTILDGNGAVPATVQFTSEKQDVNEGASATLTVQLNAPVTQNVSIPYTITGTATNGGTSSDFTLTPATPLTIEAGKTSVTLNLAALADVLNENDETVVVTLGTPSNAQLGAQPRHTVTIKNVPPQANPLVQFAAATATVNEGHELTIIVQLAAATDKDVAVTYEVTGSAENQLDYQINDPSPITIPAGKSSFAITLESRLDAQPPEPDETVILTIKSATNATLGTQLVHTVTIKDVVPLPPPTAKFTITAQEKGEGDTAEFAVQIELSADAQQRLSIPVEFSTTSSARFKDALAVPLPPFDYTVKDFNFPPVFALSIAPGTRSASFLLTINDDNLQEPDEQAVLTIQDAQGYVVGQDKTYTLTIKDDDTPGAVQPGVIAFGAATFSLGEDKGTLALPVTRTGGTTGAVTVQYAVTVPTNLKLKNRATPGADFTGALTGSITFNAGEDKKTLSFPLKTDDLVEVTETFVVTLSGPTGGATLGSQTTITVNILDVNLPIVANEQPNLNRLQLAGSGFGKSEEHYRDFITKAYARFLDRAPDENGFKYWVTLMQLYETSNHAEGLRQEQIEAGFINAPEYKGRYGGTAGQQWIRGIYNDLLGRPAEQAGVDFWMGQLAAGVSPAQVALGFTASDERLRNRVTDTYRTLLDREPDAPGLAYWIAIFKNGGTTEDINSGFVGSIEYYNKADSSAGNPAKWIRDAYLDILFRPASVAEFDYWQRFLKG